MAKTAVFAAILLAIFIASYGLGRVTGTDDPTETNPSTTTLPSGPTHASSHP